MIVSADILAQRTKKYDKTITLLLYRSWNCLRQKKIIAGQVFFFFFAEHYCCVGVVRKQFYVSLEPIFEKDK